MLEVSLSEHLYILRRRQKMTILELSAKSGINRNTIAAIESGDGIMDVKLETLISLAKALDFVVTLTFSSKREEHTEAANEA
jgi:transcriptional regulator with XRE-family HTH domain